jgi:hypothetical protein
MKVKNTAGLALRRFIVIFISAYFFSSIFWKYLYRITFYYARIQLASATPPHLAKTSAGVLKPKHFIGVALILLATLSIFSCVVKRQLCFLGK